MVEFVGVTTDPVTTYVVEGEHLNEEQTSPPEGGLFLLFSLPATDAERATAVAHHMAMVGSIMEDGQVTIEEAAQLLALTYPDLAHHPQLAGVLEAADEAVRALRNDGKISPAEATTIIFALLSGIPGVAELSNAAQALVRRVLAVRGGK